MAERVIVLCTNSVNAVTRTRRFRLVAGYAASSWSRLERRSDVNESSQKSYGDQEQQPTPPRALEHTSWCQFSSAPFFTEPHSLCRASMASTFVARRAGTYDERRNEAEHQRHRGERFRVERSDAKRP